MNIEADVAGAGALSAWTVARPDGMATLHVLLDPDDLKRLRGRADAECRSVSMQAAWAIRQHLRTLGSPLLIGEKRPEVVIPLRDGATFNTTAKLPDPAVPTLDATEGEENLRSLIRRLVDPIHGDAAWGDEMIVDSAIAEIAMLRDHHLGACKTVAEMHAAAMGCQSGPIRGVVEDVADLRVVADQMTARCDELERLGSALCAHVRSTLATAPDGGDVVHAWESFMRRSSEEGRMVPKAEPIEATSAAGPQLRTVTVAIDVDTSKFEAAIAKVKRALSDFDVEQHLSHLQDGIVKLSPETSDVADMMDALHDADDLVADVESWPGLAAAVSDSWRSAALDWQTNRSIPLQNQWTAHRAYYPGAEKPPAPEVDDLTVALAVGWSLIRDVLPSCRTSDTEVQAWTERVARWRDERYELLIARWRRRYLNGFMGAEASAP